MVQRTKPDANISVAQLQACFESFMSKMNSRDLHSLFKVAFAVHKFKWAPCPKAIGSLAVLLSELLDVAKNGALPRARLATAIMSCHGFKACNYSGEETEVWAQKIGEVTRVQCTHLRKLLDPEQRSITYKKASLHRRGRARHILSKPTQIP